MKLTTILIFLAAMLMTTILSLVYAAPATTEFSCLCKIGERSHEFPVVEEVHEDEELFYLSFKPHQSALTLALTGENSEVNQFEIAENCCVIKKSELNQNSVISVLSKGHVLEMFSASSLSK